ncbi:energy-coupling factor transporter transmembrane component T family protein [Rhodopseudomonas palustris]|uniref:Cobalt transport protein n=1 Tax=Rhodopseudomonas palustris (strain BisB18) TaxID=316056 RepID=Q21AF5_RHOPB
MTAAGPRWIASAPLAGVPVGWKLTVLAALGAGLAFVERPWLLAAAFGLSLCALLATGLGPRQLWRGLKGPVVIVACIALLEGWQHGMVSAAVVTLRLVTLICFAHAVTSSTSVLAMTAVIESALRPLERIGLLDAERAGLTLTLAIRFVPLIVDEIAAIREAQAMRGLDRSIVALAVPLVVRIILRAQDLADAIDLRGPPPRSGGGATAGAVVTPESPDGFAPAHPGSGGDQLRASAAVPYGARLSDANLGNGDW